MKAADVLVIADLPQLRLLAWSRNPGDTITGQEAFALYERNWRFVDESGMSEHERAVLARLTREYGNGVLHV